MRIRRQRYGRSRHDTESALKSVKNSKFYCNGKIFTFFPFPFTTTVRDGQPVPHPSPEIPHTQGELQGDASLEYSDLRISGPLVADTLPGSDRQDMVYELVVH